MSKIISCPFHHASGCWGTVLLMGGMCEMGEDCPGLAAGCCHAWDGANTKNTANINKQFADYAKRLGERLGVA